ncbi:MAG: glycosyl transferase [Burkholderiales bacterium 21-58-4]|nr:MAG: glycosyl transferase [Burkholderiales bacterium 21-58-4]HQU09175.1 glycosyltransferase [Opitutales bacterium]
MAHFPIFLSVVLVARNSAQELPAILTQASSLLATLVSDYELIVVDNASEDPSLSVLKKLTSEDGLPNIQVYALTQELEANAASWVGVENALGDFIAVIDPLIDDINFLPNMIDQAVSGADVVFASNKQKPKTSLAYRACAAVFNSLYKWFNGIDLAKEAPQYKILSKRVVNFILQHPMPHLTYRYLPASGGFQKINLSYSATPLAPKRASLNESIDRGIRLLVSTTRAPMRIVTTLSLFGGVANIVYSVYVIIIALVKKNVAPGWVTLSLQQSGMFFLISLVLLVLGEYILHMASISNEGPLYHVANEFTSAVMTRHQKLNLEEVKLAEPTCSQS